MPSFHIIFVFILLLLNVILDIGSYHDNREWDQTLQRDVRQIKTRKFTQTEEELKLTKNFIINGQTCKGTNSLSVFIHSAGRSAGKYFDRRQTLRNTWVKDLKNLNISVYFAIALNTNDTINQELKEESDKYQDIIQFGFIDDYYNLTLKSISILQWIDKNCLNSAHILKTDDDTLINTKLLLDKLPEFKPAIYGNGYPGYPVPSRDKNNKFYIPFDVYPNESYPLYVSGGAYLMAGNVTHSLVNSIEEYCGPVFLFEDLFIAGIIAEKAGIPRIVTKLIDYINCKVNVCELYEKIAIFECKDTEELQIFWSEWRDTSYEYCRNTYYFKIIGIPLLLIIVIVIMFIIYFYLYKKHLLGLDKVLGVMFMVPLIS